MKLPHTGISYFFALLLQVVALLFLSCTSMFSQEQTYNFSHLSSEDGLVYDWVYGAVLDQEGYLWFATLNGLSRYEGNNFRNYQFNPLDTNSIAGNTVVDILEDEKGRLWIATMGVGGLNLFDREKEIFERFVYPQRMNEGQNPIKLYQDLYDENILWIGTYGSALVRYNKDKNEFKRFDIINDTTTKNLFTYNSVVAIEQDINDENKLWVGTNDGLYHFDKQSNQFVAHRYPSQKSAMSILSVLSDGSETLWLGTNSYGLVEFKIKTEEWIFYRADDQLNRNYDNYFNTVNQIEEGPNGNLWLCSESHGLMLFDKATKQLKFFQSDNKNEFSIKGNEVTGMYTDNSDRFWFFNKLSGISVLDIKNQKLKFTSLKNLKTCHDFQYKQATDFIRVRNSGDLLVTTAGCYGLYVFGKNGKLKNSLPLDLGGKKNKEVYLIQDSQNTIWLLGAGIKTYNPITEKITRKFENQLIDTSQIVDVLESRDGFLWMTTWKNGLVKLDTKSKIATRYIKSKEYPNAPESNSIIYDLLEDSKGDLWLATHHKGVFKYDRKKDKFTKYKISGFQPLTLAETKDRKIWVGGFSQGIRVIDPELPPNPDKKLPSIREKEGLISDQITHLLKDDQGNMWVNTRFGLCVYDVKKEVFRTFGKDEGIRETYQNPFNVKKGFKLMENGDIMIGERHGFYRTNAEMIMQRKAPPKVLITDFKILKEEKEIGKRIKGQEKITLAHNENFFVVEFAALDFSNPTKNQFAYILEGLNDDWIYLKNENSISFTGIQPGDYTLKVKAANSDGVWNEEGVQLAISIRPPWWATIGAYLVYSLLGLAGIYWLYQFQLRRKLENMETQRLQELDVLKTRLYNNITHEFRTPLTVILGMADELSKQVSGGVGERLKMIKRNGKNLLSLVNQMLDLSKLESGQMKLNLVQGDLVGFLRYVTESFQSYAEHKKIILTFYSELDELKMDYDAKRIQHIVSNLLSNAIKFTETNGKIILHISKENSDLVLIVKDTGIGIEDRNLPSLFDRFYQIDDSSTRKAEGTGIGLALTKELAELMQGSISVKSKLREGTEFTVRLPITKNAKEVLFKREEDYDRLLDTSKVTLLTEDAIIERTAVDPRKYTELPELLIIEDNVDVLDYVQLCLKQDYNISVAYNGQEGIDKALELVPDIIISDVMMPEKDGFEVTDFLKNDERTSHIPIILLTGRVDDNSKIEGLKRGADAYLAKPFNKQELGVRLEKLIEVRQKLQKRYSNITIDNISPDTERQFEIEDAVLTKLKSIVEKHLDNPDFNISQFCREAGMSRAQLHRKLKALTNKSATIFIRSIRLQKAKELLETTDMSVKEIAYDVGFSSPAYFSTSFLEEFNVTPSETRK